MTALRQRLATPRSGITNGARQGADSCFEPQLCLLLSSVSRNVRICGASRSASVKEAGAFRNRRSLNCKGLIRSCT